MDYINNNLFEIAKAGNTKFIEKLGITELDAQTIFNCIKYSNESQKSVEIAKSLLNKPDNIEQEAQALKIAYEQNNVPVAWLILNTWSNLQPVEKLDVSNCKLDSFPSIPSKVRENLREIDLTGNNIEFLNISPLKFPNLTKVTFDGNPLSIYPERCRNSWPKMREYLLSVEKRSGEKNIRKLLIVGEEAVGKSTILKCLRKKSNKTNVTENISTDGIDISDITLENLDSFVLLKTWDFGGQEVYYPSHQFFLTPKAIYILCFNLASLNMPRILYWLQQIQAITKNTGVDAVVPPILLVGTHLDDKICTNEYIADVSDKITKLFQKYRYSGFFKIFYVSCKNGRGFPELKDELYTISMKSFQNRGVIHSSWVLFLDFLQRTRESGVDYLEWEKYRQSAMKFKLQGSVLSACTSYLMDIGYILHFTLGNSQLVILDPQFLSNLMMCVFTTQKTFIKRGILYPSDVPNILRAYRPYLHPSLIELLTKFEIIYQMSSGEFLIPDLLPLEEPTDELRRAWSLDTPDLLTTIELGRVYRFDFLPLGFFSRLIVRLLNYKYIEGILTWKNGAILALETSKNYGKVLYNEITGILSITVRLPKDTTPTFKYSLLRIIIDEIEMLLECYYPRLMDSAERLITCTHCMRSGLPNSRPFLFTYEEVMNSLIAGKMTVFCNYFKAASRKVKIVELAPDICLVDLPKINPKDIVITSDIGEGSFGKIYKGLWFNVPVAVKAVKCMMGIDRTKFNEFRQECSLMCNLEHPNIVNLYGITVTPMQMVMELVEHGDLYELIHPIDPNDPLKRNRLPSDISKYSFRYRMKIALDIARGMQYLQTIKPPVIHRDLRSPNIFIVSMDSDDDIVAKVADFGLSRSIANSMAGTLSSWQWLAPEVISSESSEYGLKSDVYSFGVVLWELVSFLHPFDEYAGVNRFTRTIKDGTGTVHKVLNPTEVKLAIINEHLRPTIPDDCPVSISQIITQCWYADPNKRPSFHEIVFLISTLLNIPANQYTSFKRRVVKNIAYPPLLNQSSEIDDNNNHQLLNESGGNDDDLLSQVYNDDSNDDEFQHVFGDSAEVPLRTECLQLCTDSSNQVWIAYPDSISVIQQLPASTTLKEKVILPPGETAVNFISCIFAISKQLWVSYIDGHISILSTSLKSLSKLSFVMENPSTPIKQFIEVSYATKDSVFVGVWGISRVDRLLLIWEAQRLAIIKRISLSALPICIVKCEKVVWVGLENGELNSFDLSSMELIGSWKAHDAPISALAYHRGMVWSGCDTGEISIWSVMEGEVSLMTTKNVLQGKVTHFHLAGDYILSTTPQSVVAWHFLSQMPLDEMNIISSAISFTVIDSSPKVVIGTVDPATVLFSSFMLPYKPNEENLVKIDDILVENNAMEAIDLQTINLNVPLNFSNEKSKKKLKRGVSIGLLRKRSPSPSSSDDSSIANNSSPNHNDNSSSNSNNESNLRRLLRRSSDHQGQLKSDPSAGNNNNNNNSSTFKRKGKTISSLFKK